MSHDNMASSSSEAMLKKVSIGLPSSGKGRSVPKRNMMQFTQNYAKVACQLSVII
jgi:hypothetical protein